MSMKLFQQIFRQSYVRPSVFANRVVNYSDAPTNTADPDQPISIVNPFKRDDRKCVLCEHNIYPDYKNVRMLSQFQSQYTGRIYGRHITGLCKVKQELVELEITKAQSLGLMGTYTKSPEFFEDPKLFDPERPIRPHRF